MVQSTIKKKNGIKKLLSENNKKDLTQFMTNFLLLRVNHDPCTRNVHNIF